ncbi:MAG: glycosyltransferase family 4 protein [Candidatus Bathyarchaeia archaeon]|jgi:glycosyltransferase involved in cell wall biosynthesis
MEVVLLNHDYPPFIFGGVGTFMLELAKGLSAKGVKVHVITGYPEPISSIGNFGFQRNTEGEIDVLRFSYPSVPPRHTVFQVWNLKKISKIVQNLNVDIIHGQCGATYPALLNLKRKAPVLVTFHTSPMMAKITSAQSIFRGGSFKDFWTYLVGYPAYHFAFLKELQYSDAAVTVSRTLRSEILVEMGEKYREKIQCIHNGVDIPSLDKEYGEAGTDIAESEETILFAGRLFWLKGSLNMIRMAYLLQKYKTKFKIIVHGIGPLFSKMQDYISSLGLKNIELRGFATRPQLMKSMRYCKFVAIPSMYEACPMILLESMCLGKIPLMLRLPFSSELTEGGKYGILGDGVKNLTDRLITLENTYSLSQLSNNIQIFARKAYNMDKVTSKYIELYRNLSSQRGQVND